ncbi:MAG: proton-conducting transporter membrane subunit [Chloroflexaceae bacterium]|nr:proton-conducting transporter membrane subunit [Chloroflexaceae bacterium]
MLTAIVLSMLALAPIGLLARHWPRPPIGWVLALLPLAAFAGFAARAPLVLDGGVLTESLPWVPEMGLSIRFSLDGLSLLFALLVSGIGTLIFLYTAYYLAGDPGMGRFYVYLAIFMGSMLGVVLADNVLLLFIFWELTSVSSYLLVGYKHDYPEARRGAQMGLLITVGGGLALLVGLVLLSNVAGSFELSEIIAAGEELRASPFYTPALLLVFLGCFTKSAQFPFHIWLPNAMQAPTPASAYLHSATMVKAGVYLLARLQPALSETPLWTYTLTAVGAATMLVGAMIALRKDDIKGLLAYSTVSLLGTMVLLTGIGGHDAPVALVTLILAHALYKGALFMLAGAVDHEAGTRKLSELGGLGREMPRTLVLTSLAALSAAGIPPLFGFVAKEEVLHAATHSKLAPGVATLIVGATVVAAVLGILYAWRLVSGIFFGPAAPRKKAHVHDAPIGMLVAPGVLTLLSVILPLGLLPVVSALLQPAVIAIAGEPEEVSLHLMPSALSLPVVLSLVAIGSGAALTRFVKQISAAPSPLPGWLDGDRIYDAAISGLLDGTTVFTRAVQNGRLRNYIRYSLLALLAVILIPLALFALGSAPMPDLSNVT